MIRNLTTLFYRYHRQLGLLVGIPMVLWTISGITHPLMVHFFASDIARRFVPPVQLQADVFQVTPGAVMRQAGYTEITNFRVVRLADDYYYQVKGTSGEIRYFSTSSGKELQDADPTYAVQLARWFLDDSHSDILEIERVEQFTAEYAYVNRLLPVYRVRFGRDDRMDVYVETFGDRLGSFNDHSKRGYLWVFRNLHTWNFLGERNDPVRITVILLFSFLTLTVGGTGVFLFATMKSKKSQSRAMRYHRRLGIVFSLFLLGFAFSGFLIAFPKYQEDSDNKFVAAVSQPVDLQDEVFHRVIRNLKTPFTQISIVEIEGRQYYQVGIRKADGNPGYVYAAADNGECLKDGDQHYALYLAERASGKGCKNVLRVQYVTRFGGDYPFIMKRIPVYKVSYPAPSGMGVNDWFIETGSGYLSQHSTTFSAVQGTTFALLHKFHFLDFLGQTARDIIIILVAISLAMISLLGLYSFAVRKRR